MRFPEWLRCSTIIGPAAFVAGCTHPASPAPAAPEEPSAPSPGDTRPSAASDPAPVHEPSSGAQPDAAAAPEAHGHQHGHDSAGYEMDFSSTERFAAHFDDPERDLWQKPDAVVALLDIEPGHTVADLGAGTGYFEAALSREVGPAGRVLALDSEPRMVRHLEQRAQAKGWSNVVARQVAGDDPGLDAATVDRILIVNTWHHISDRSAYAAKLEKALRDRGVVLVVDFTKESDIGPPERHRLTPEQVVQELAAGGLRAAAVTESLPKQYVVRATK